VPVQASLLILGRVLVFDSTSLSHLDGKGLVMTKAIMS